MANVNVDPLNKLFKLDFYKRQSRWKLGADNRNRDGRPPRASSKKTVTFGRKYIYTIVNEGSTDMEHPEVWHLEHESLNDTDNSEVKSIDSDTTKQDDIDQEDIETEAEEDIETEQKEEMETKREEDTEIKQEDDIKTEHEDIEAVQTSEPPESEATLQAAAENPNNVQPVIKGKVTLRLEALRNYVNSHPELMKTDNNNNSNDENTSTDEQEIDEAVDPYNFWMNWTPQEFIRQKMEALDNMNMNLEKVFNPDMYHMPLSSNQEPIVDNVVYQVPAEDWDDKNNNSTDTISFQNTSLESINTFMHNVQQEPHSSEHGDSLNQSDNMSESGLAGMTENQLTDGINKHYVALFLLFEECDKRCHRRQRQMREYKEALENEVVLSGSHMNYFTLYKN